MLQTLPVGGDKDKPVAWTRVKLVDGVRVVSVVSRRAELSAVADDDEPHTFAGVELAGVGISVVHVGALFACFSYPSCTSSTTSMKIQ